MLKGQCVKKIEFSFYSQVKHKAYNLYKNTTMGSTNSTENYSTNNAMHNKLSKEQVTEIAQRFDNYLDENCIDPVIDKCCKLLLSGNIDLSNIHHTQKHLCCVYDFVLLTQHLTQTELLYYDDNNYYFSMPTKKVKSKKYDPWYYIANFSPLIGLTLQYPPFIDDLIEHGEEIGSLYGESVCYKSVNTCHTNKSIRNFVAKIDFIGNSKYLEIAEYTLLKNDRPIYDSREKDVCQIQFNFTKLFKNTILTKTHLEKLKILRDQLLQDTITDKKIICEDNFRFAIQELIKALQIRNNLLVNYDKQKDEFEIAQLEYEQKLKTSNAIGNNFQSVYNKYTKNSDEQIHDLLQYLNGDLRELGKLIDKTLVNINKFKQNIVDAYCAVVRNFDN